MTRMPHDAYRAHLLRLRVSNHLDALDFDKALEAAEEAIRYPAASLPPDPVADKEAVDAQALFDWASGLEMRGIVFRHRGDCPRSISDLDLAEKALRMILIQFPMDENHAELAKILHHRSSSRLMIHDTDGAGRDATLAIQIRRKLAANDPEELGLLAGTLKARSSIFSIRGQHQYAVMDASEAVTIRRKALPPNPDYHQKHVFAMTLYTLAHVLLASGDKGKAREAIDEAIELIQKLAGPEAAAVVQQDLETCLQLQALVG
jgi:tetratricopeptide (TPR) repeat protein